VVLDDRTVVMIPLGDLVDREKECRRLAAELAQVDGFVAAQLRKLDNEQFVARAPADIVAKERDKLAGWHAQAATLREKRQALQCGD
jgi:valyl-tRNA synthetase